MASVASPGSLQRVAAATCYEEYYGRSLFQNDRNSTQTVSCPWDSTQAPKSSAADHPDKRQRDGQVLVDSVSSNSSAACRKSAIRNKRQSTQATDQDTTVVKNVHFDETFEQSCFFLSADAPRALIQDITSTGNGEDGIVSEMNLRKRLCLLHSPLASPSAWQPVQLESLEILPTGKQIKGTVKVLNLGLEKDVAARFTFDGWKTVSEVAAEHGQSLYLGNSIVSDRFAFLIDPGSLPFEIGNIIRVCIRYNVLDQEYWDNNGGTNFNVTLSI
ncbi:protein phosphatase regulator [Penicillium waksmanii]|uniref:protein phosphatase regulator n=1 Tax=Penicillium waksmanii TaxID=69791 RepID=UPI0025498C55|nr:protein phosphatase regulator [Penicillium waksmanii]KAJ6001009.1 protein phosphatase regulator [Penicillium waksmanii]